MGDDTSQGLPFAYRIQCKMTRQEIQARLNEKGPWTWLGGDSEYDGLYLRAVPGPGARLRILGETPPRYDVEIDLNPAISEDLTLEELHRVVLNEVLPEIGATVIEGYGSG